MIISKVLFQDSEKKYGKNIVGIVTSLALNVSFTGVITLSEML